MNRSKRPSDKQTKKKMAKEVRRSQPTPVSKPPLSDTLSPQKTLTRYPKKIASKDRNIVKGSLKQMSVEKAKKTKKRSKRTTPSLVNFGESPPHIVHVEGKRWIKTLERQSIAKNQIFRKKTAKKLPSGKTRKLLKGSR